MTITYTVPNGTMHINADEFFRLAGKRQIQRMLKQLKQDRKAMDEYMPLIREFLEDQEQDIHNKMAGLTADLVNAVTRYREAQAKYLEMQNPCYACFTRDKKKLMAAKTKISEARSDRDYIERRIAEARKLRQRHKDIQGYIDKILIS